jgi:hypothetical protein
MLALDIELEADKRNELEQLLASPEYNEETSTAELCGQDDMKGGDNLPVAA